MEKQWWLNFSNGSTWIQAPHCAKPMLCAGFSTLLFVSLIYARFQSSFILLKAVQLSSLSLHPLPFGNEGIVSHL